ncbi:MAG: AAA family ATPase [Melioribacteraceae bacterium]|nr:MAG: AAA family ATPase [Melioribacteraceae bacterium]
MIKNINFPISSNAEQNNNQIETESSIVIIGANGSGKSRLGSWFEFKSEVAKNVHRISAQKSLTMPNSVSPVSLDKAKAQLYYGYYNDNSTNTYKDYYDHKIGQRWRSNPETFLLNDYDKLLVYLYSDNYEEVLRYKQESEKSSTRIEPPVTKLDKIKNIWESLLPKRELIIESGSVKTRRKGSDESYFASSMSDGERVIFYLIGECLCAPENGIIVIDEPELHLHHSLHQKLWTAIENDRSDCLFIYLTHDLEFASTKLDAVKICLNEYDGSEFDWFEIPKNVDIPEDLYLEVLGSRNKVLFIEGTSGSHDVELYSLIYPEFTIKPLGASETVIECVKSFNKLSELHYNVSYGIVDRDYKNDDHIIGIQKHQVYVPEFAEVENIFLLEEVLLAVSSQLCLPDSANLINQIKDWVISEFDRFKEKYATDLTSYTINLALNGFDGRANTKEQLSNKYNDLKTKIDIDDIYNSALNEAEDLIRGKKYQEILMKFNHKGIVNQVGKFFEIKPSAYVKKVKDIIHRGNTSILDEMKNHLPKLENA